VKKQGTLENQVKYAYLSLGSNLGNRYNNLQRAKFWLNYIGISIKKSSSIYESESWPNRKFPKYLNIVLMVQTTKSISEFFKEVKFIEKKIGRKKGPKYSPRICDIDILDFDKKIIEKKVNNQKLIIPHPRLHERNFVLIPLYEIEKKWRHPKLMQKITTLLLKINTINLSSIKIL